MGQENAGCVLEWDGANSNCRPFTGSLFMVGRIATVGRSIMINGKSVSKFTLTKNTVDPLSHVAYCPKGRATEPWTMVRMQSNGNAG